MDVDSIQRCCPVCRVHSRVNELHCRCRVQDSHRLDRLETASSLVQNDQSEVGSTGGRLVRITPVHSASMLLQLETRSISRGNRCLQPAMGTAEGLFSRVRTQVKNHQAQIFLITPVWKTNFGTLFCWGCYMITLDSYPTHQVYSSRCQT